MKDNPTKLALVLIVVFLGVPFALAVGSVIVFWAYFFAALFTGG